MGALRAQYGETASVLRLQNDLERLEIDTQELEQAPVPAAQPAQRADVIYVPDSRSDEAAWMGAQDEGLGFHSRERTK
jgi:hypothetical protein